MSITTSLATRCKTPEQPDATKKTGSDQQSKHPGDFALAVALCTASCLTFTCDFFASDAFSLAQRAVVGEDKSKQGSAVIGPAMVARRSETATIAAGDIPKVLSSISSVANQ